MEKFSTLLPVRTKGRKKTDTSKWTSLKSLKGAFESEKMVHLTNREDKNKWNDYCYLYENPEWKLKLIIPTSTQKPTPKGARIWVNVVYHCINFL